MSPGESGAIAFSAGGVCVSVPRGSNKGAASCMAVVHAKERSRSRVRKSVLMRAQSPQSPQSAQHDGEHESAAQDRDQGVVRGSLKSFEQALIRGMEKFVLKAPTPLLKLIASIMFYPSLYWNLYMNKDASGRRWYDRVMPYVILGALPLRSILSALVETEHVSLMINTVREWKGMPREYAKHGLEQLYVPMVDFVPPSLSDLEACVEKVHEFVQQQKTVYVHCKAGRGRSASVVMCYLIKYANMTPEQANEFLVSKRPQVIAQLHERPVIQEFYRVYGTGGHS
ncbi:putative dual specificity protein phosphatase DSP8 [Porphyridium purpureum]|uniref:Putative dual specificity protein phosphatase DSP8 n=1 Tax=Porphyridium purpureum TaxID=35688 RepID=A0A5J4YRW6_PORPP|nr:putative dual specificity protein phosphatase DSP8 [Porphyridium purpureum]|eukprot:POR9776..scf229_5